ncbi:MAG: GYD domain-containing protein [Kiritimatiellota bacterium]|nr:GYD domain-containing protein [Kiritimatiellota bacterium]
MQPGVIKEPGDFKEVAKKVAAKIKEECPKVHWHESYVTLGRFDVVDIVECDDLDQVQRCSVIIRTLGHSTTETLMATPWKHFIESL